MHSVSASAATPAASGDDAVKAASRRGTTRRHSKACARPFRIAAPPSPPRSAAPPAASHQRSGGSTSLRLCRPDHHSVGASCAGPAGGGAQHGRVLTSSLKRRRCTPRASSLRALSAVNVLAAAAAAALQASKPYTADIAHMGQEASRSSSTLCLRRCEPAARDKEGQAEWTSPDTMPPTLCHQHYATNTLPPLLPSTNTNTRMLCRTQIDDPPTSG
eukprot:76297-Chlamydomonas_euryale.AAC.8